VKTKMPSDKPRANFAFAVIPLGSILGIQQNIDCQSNCIKPLYIGDLVVLIVKQRLAKSFGIFRKCM